MGKEKKKEKKKRKRNTLGICLNYVLDRLKAGSNSRIKKFFNTLPHGVFRGNINLLQVDILYMSSK